jgi:tryptophan halogenase
MDKLYGINTEYFIGVSMNVTVVGGGTAGWITALMVYVYYYNRPKHESPLKMTVIESEEIGILGAGEGTTPQFPQFLHKTDINISEIIKNCGATVKHGINFSNWNGDGKDYFHNFGVNENLTEHDYGMQAYILGQKRKINDLSFIKKIVEDNKVSLSFKNDKYSYFKDPINSFDIFSNFALHFDARKLASFLKKIAISRGVNLVEGKIKDFKTNEFGYIKSVVLENDNEIKSDFVFDCSGFSRLVLGKKLNAEWISYEKNLPLDTAIPFFIPHDGNVSPRTDAIAMKNGWVWKIPVEGRYGCGYVFDSDYTNQDEALKEAEEYFGIKLESPKTFKFKPGSFKQTLIKNCMAVGLSQSFVEPLEATSIMISINNLNDFLENDGMNSFFIEIFSKNFNRRCLSRNEEVVEFLVLHYMTKRNDSNFWKEFRQKNEIPDSVLEKIELTNHLLSIDIEQNRSLVFQKYSWIEVCDGLDLINNDIYLRNLYKIFENRNMNVTIEALIRNQNNVAYNCLTHKDFLEYMRKY